MDSRELTREVRRFKKIVIWGLRKRWHTHRFIHAGFYHTLKKLDIPVVWVEDEKKNASIIETGDLVISSEVYGRMVPKKETRADYALPIKNGVSYALHNYQKMFTERIPAEAHLNFFVYEKTAEQYEKISDAVFFDRAQRSLYQPWGTPLLPEEFKKPIFSNVSRVFWVGSIWNNELNQGNLYEIEKLTQALKRREMQFIHTRFIPDWLHVLLIRHSRLAPAIAGRYQVDIGYLPCRMFKNVSYGQLGFSNVQKFNDLFRDCAIYEPDIDRMVDRVVSLSGPEYREIVSRQQEVCKRYTYVQYLRNIIRFLG